ncbi:MAG: alpha/beta hydrolase fold domain-containing protein [Pseudomonadota bacterium]
MSDVDFPTQTATAPSAAPVSEPAKDAVPGSHIDPYLDEQYNNSGRVENAAALIDAYINDSHAFRETVGEQAAFGLSYGPNERNKMDIFWPQDRENCPIAMFVHGGYWQMLEGSGFSHMAKGLLAHNVAVAVPSYTLCPDITVDGIIDELRRACAVLWKTYGRKLTVFGHSAGGHLTACLFATYWDRMHPDLPADLVSAGLGISGLYDLAPLIPTKVNEPLRLTSADMDHVSPIGWLVEPQTRFDAWVGGDESDEYHKQSRNLAERWYMLGAETHMEVVAGANHFTIIDQLTDPNSPMVHRILELMRHPQAAARFNIQPASEIPAAELAAVASAAAVVSAADAIEPQSELEENPEPSEIVDDLQANEPADVAANEVDFGEPSHSGEAVQEPAIDATPDDMIEAGMAPTSHLEIVDDGEDLSDRPLEPQSDLEESELVTASELQAHHVETLDDSFTKTPAPHMAEDSPPEEVMDAEPVSELESELAIPQFAEPEEEPTPGPEAIEVEAVTDEDLNGERFEEESVVSLSGNEIPQDNATEPAAHSPEIAEREWDPVPQSEPDEVMPVSNVDLMGVLEEEPAIPPQPENPVIEDGLPEATALETATTAPDPDIELVEPAPEEFSHISSPGQNEPVEEAVVAAPEPTIEPEPAGSTLHFDADPEAESVPIFGREITETGTESQSKPEFVLPSSDQASPQPEVLNLQPVSDEPPVSEDALLRALQGELETPSPDSQQPSEPNPSDLDFAAALDQALNATPEPQPQTAHNPVAPPVDLPKIDEFADFETALSEMSNLPNASPPPTEASQDLSSLASALEQPEVAPPQAENVAPPTGTDELSELLALFDKTDDQSKSH